VPAPAAIHVHVLQGNTLKPIPGQQIQVAYYSDAVTKRDHGYSIAATIRIDHLVTNELGVAASIPPLQEQYRVVVSEDPLDVSSTLVCGNIAFCVKDVLSTGELPVDYCHHNKNRLPASVAPGDFYIYMRHVSGLEWAFHETFFGSVGFSRKDSETMAQHLRDLHCPG